MIFIYLVTNINKNQELQLADEGEGEAHFDTENFGEDNWLQGVTEKETQKGCQFVWGLLYIEFEMSTRCSSEDDWQ